MGAAGGTGVVVRTVTAAAEAKESPVNATRSVPTRFPLSGRGTPRARRYAIASGITRCSPAASVSVPEPLPPPDAATYVYATDAGVVPRFTRTISEVKKAPCWPVDDRTTGTKSVAESGASARSAEEPPAGS